MEKQKNKKIGILGCGWLGLPLGEKLVEEGYEVRGSTRTHSRFDTISAVGIAPYLVICEEDKTSGLSLFLKGLDALFICLPPGLRSQPKASFVKVIEHIIPEIEQEKIKKVLFTSSTSVYGKQGGELDENAECHPKTESGKQLLICEKRLQNSTSFTSTLIRLGGLFSPKRNIARYVLQKDCIENPDGFINYIHQKDAVGILYQCLIATKPLGIINGVSPHHPKRMTYFKHRAKILGQTCPPAGEMTEVPQKISAEKAIKLLGYAFIVDNLLIQS